MEIKGKLFKILPQTSGVGKNGNWVKQEIVIETDGQYPKKVAVTCFNKVVDSIEQLTEGMILTAHINLESQEWEGRWFTNANAWKLEFTGGKNVSQKTEPTTIVDPNDDLPF